MDLLDFHNNGTIGPSVRLILQGVYRIYTF